MRFSVIISLLAALSLVFVLMGCGSLRYLLTETQEIAATGEANPQIEAALTITDDFVNDPWRWFAAMGIGYVSAMLRRWYKKKQGSKTT